MIELRNVVKKFGRITAVNDITLRVGEGEFFGFLGPNGAGKTTTIKMLVGLFAPTSGSCLIHGHDVHREPLKAKRHLAYVPDQPYLYEKLTGREFLYFVGGVYGMTTGDIEAGVETMSGVFEIGEFLDRRAEEYSQGMRQRVVLASALLHNPSVLVIDEPLVGLDPRSARLVKTTLKERSAAGLTILMSTHLLDIVEELCGRIAIMHRGRLVDERVRPAEGGFDGQLESLFLDITR
jgi:ABC-2 type transport system ATP-binding protein